MAKPTITIEQVGSPIGRHHEQRETLIGLKLNRIGRISRLKDTPEVLGMVEKVKHLVKIHELAPSELKPLLKLRFEALAGYTRHPDTVLVFEELEWYATADERLVGILTRDYTDNDFGWMILGRDERLRFRAIDVDCSFNNAEKARIDLFDKLNRHYAKPDEEFHQGDAPGPVMDFLTPRIPETKLNPTFTTLNKEVRFSPARGLIEAMMCITKMPMVTS